MTIQEFKDNVSQPYAWPGGYPRYAVTDDGGTLCFACLEKEKRRVLSALKDDDKRGGWFVIAFEINWESDLYCDNCSQVIESAYDVPETTEAEAC